jgi:hypothetical protein
MASLTNFDKLLLDKKRLEDQLAEVDKQIENYQKNNFMIDIPVGEYVKLKKYESLAVGFAKEVFDNQYK